MRTIHHYCTYFDHIYLPRALALYESLLQHDPEFRLWTLCFDDLAEQRMRQLNLPYVVTVSLEEFLRSDTDLAFVRNKRSTVEFYFTCSPSLPLYVFACDETIDHVTYLDADLFFYEDPILIFEEIGEASIAIIAHRFPEKLKHLEENGVFNVGWLTFRRDGQGMGCLNRWRDQCLDWCFDRIEGERYADQGYLNEWPRLYSNLKIIEQKGANLAPWNVGRYKIAISGDQVLVDDDPLVFFHFQSLARISPAVYKLNFGKYTTIPSEIVREHIYRPYIRTLERITMEQDMPGSHKRVRSPGDTLENVFDFSNPFRKANLRRSKQLILDYFKKDFIRI
jgi:hypothetical protein